jgi:signal transduction histidine kinase
MPLRRFFSATISPRTVLRALAAGFGIVLVLMGAASGVALQQAAIVRKSAEGLVREQLLMARLLNEVQLEEKALTEALHRVARSPSQLDRAELLADLAHADSALERLATETAHTHEALTWAELQRCAASFTQEVRRVLRGSQKAAREEIDGLFVLHDRVVQLSRQLLDDTTEHLRAAEALIESESRTLSSELGLLLGSSFLIAGACAAGTLAYARQSIRQIESQSDELDRVSWHMLQTQETVARRFSHELHDELGQSLAAVKANLTIPSQFRDRAQHQADCVRLVDSAIENVRSLSQLLRPVILDDFGLEAGLRWLCDGFGQRTRIEVNFASTVPDRLHMDTETHLFRIAQEALTNVARHSKASSVNITLHRVGEDLQLVLEDNGRGLPSDPAARRASVGLVGMRARARECGGRLLLEPVTPTGLRVAVTVPARPPEEPLPEGAP